jgi:hypothetical protein
MGKLIITTTYGVTPNHILNMSNMSLKAKGLFAYLQAKPADWKFSIERIALQNKEGKSAIRATLKELEENGLLLRKPVKNTDGKWIGYDYILSEKPLSEKRTTENPSAENYDTLSKKEISKKDIVIKKDTLATTSVAEKNETNIILEAFQMKINPTVNFGNKTQRKACEELIKAYSLEKVLNTIDYLEKIQSDPFSPSITTPYQLKEKFSQLVNYYNRSNNKIKKTAGVII